MKRSAPREARQLALSFDGPAATPSTAPTTPGGRCLLLGHEALHYTLRRARRRSIGFTIDDRGLSISAPRWVTVREVEAAIVEKQRWIRSRLEQWRDWRARQPVPKVHFGDGGTLRVLGQAVKLRLRPAAEATRLVGSAEQELQIALPTDACEQQVRDAVQSWLKAEARRVLGERLDQLAARSGVPPRGWALSSARSQWGSCTHDGRIRLNWRLLHFPLAVIDYVVAHELAHLQEMNHSARFWRAVGELLPGFEAARDEIKGVDLAWLPV